MMKGNFLSSNSFDIYSNDQSDLLKNMANSIDIMNKSLMAYNDIMNKVEIEILASKTFKDICQQEFKSIQQEIEISKKDNESRMMKFVSDLQLELENANPDPNTIKDVPITNQNRSQELNGFSQFINDPKGDDQNRNIYQFNQ